MPKTKKDIATRLANAIQASQKSHTTPWAEVGVEAEPELSVDGVGSIAFPVKPATAKKLIEAGEPAPFGRGTETVVDKNVRNAYQIDADDLTLGQEFAAAIRRAAMEAARQLSLDADRLRVEPYKLVIYPKGGFFDEHRDSEKAAGMIATMVVSLPSRFTGGELRVRHRGREHTFFCDWRHQKDPSRAALFFADCPHRVERVRTGNRLTLTFNVSLDPTKSPRKVKSSTTVPSKLLNPAVEHFATYPDKPLVFPLEHYYTADGLLTERLKGIDRDVFSQVNKLAEAIDSLIYLVHVERHVCYDAYRPGDRYAWGEVDRSGKKEYLIAGEIDGSIVMDHWRDGDGHRIDWEPLGCEPSQFVGLTDIEDWKPTREEYEGYTGNAGNTLDRWYHRAAIAMWPRSSHFRVLGQMGVPTLIGEYLRLRDLAFDAAADDDEDEVMRLLDQMQNVADAILDRWPSAGSRFGHGDSPAFEQFAVAVAETGDPDFVARFARVVAARDKRTPLISFAKTSLDLIPIDELLATLESLLRITPPPNRHGVRFDQNLSQREMDWLNALAATQHDEWNLRHQHSLNRVAVERFIADVERVSDEDHWHRDGLHPPDTLLKALLASDDAESLRSVFATIDANPTLFDDRRSRIPLAIQLRKAIAKTASKSAKAVIGDWIESVRQKVRIWVEHPPQPYQDARRPAEIDENGDYAKQLKAFLEDPVQTTLEIAAAAHHREQLENIILNRQLDLRTETIRRGSPHTLRMTKTDDSYHRAIKLHREDRRRLKDLGG